MSRSICIVGMILVAMVLLVSACDMGQEAAPAPTPAPMQPLAPPVQQVPVPPPVATPATPPPTPLIPIEAETGTAPSGGGSGGGSVDAPILGLPTDGSDLIGNYSCSFNAKGLPTGPFNLPPFGCRIFKDGGGALKVGPTSRKSSSALRGSINKPTEKGFFIVGSYKFPGNEVNIKARMMKKGGAQTYSGKGRGTLNDSRKTKINYTLKMDKK